MKRISFKRKSNYSNSWKSVIFLLILMTVIGGFGRMSKLLDVRAAEAKAYKSQLDVREIEIQEIKQEKVVLAIQAKESKPVYLREDQIKKILTILMPKEKDRNRFMAILACENASHDPKRVNVNKPGLGYDLGVAQINSRFHSNRVKEFFGQEFDEAMQDPVKNLVYSVYLYQHSGFEPWVCNRIVASK